MVISIQQRRRLYAGRFVLVIARRKQSGKREGVMAASFEKGGGVCHSGNQPCQVEVRGDEIT